MRTDTMNLIVTFRNSVNAATNKNTLAPCYFKWRISFVVTSFFLSMLFNDAVNC